MVVVNRNETHDDSDKYFKPGVEERLELQNGVVAATVAVLTLNAEWAAEDAFDLAHAAAYSEEGKAEQA